MAYTRMCADISNFSSSIGKNISMLVTIFLRRFDCIRKALVSQSTFADPEQTYKNGNYTIVSF